MPDVIFSKCEACVIEVVKAEIRERGRCFLSLAEMGVRAGVARSTTSKAIRKARDAGDIIVRRRQDDGLSNVITLPKSVSM
jgi:hypothetical protein